MQQQADEVRGYAEAFADFGTLIATLIQTDQIIDSADQKMRLVDDIDKQLNRKDSPYADIFKLIDQLNQLRSVQDQERENNRQERNKRNEREKP